MKTTDAGTILLPELPFEPLQKFFEPAAPFFYAVNDLLA